ncbi:hypothetical protein PPERSA_12301 [Pseudocohnilembus persalinus]|uniref:Uncharacterized protein n=1 Tax=Pseudocohnilembus persalinus TaxID=266149 RepID=A0A0V0R4Z2_PSEPJ|nr:hypothetical protein PPERSA_12301 [Pseudocohnilembus persalinus]|eukprot:KRX09558.1 hypothetical protein PPERSA_12301 [Pseudocohnilembus persalinus]
MDRLQTTQQNTYKQLLLNNPSHQSLSSIGQNIVTSSGQFQTENQKAFGGQSNMAKTERYRQIYQPVSQPSHFNNNDNNNTMDEKMKQRQKYQELQQEQLRQMEEKKRREEQEREKNKQEEIRMQEKIKRDQEEEERKILENIEHQVKKQNKNLNQSYDPRIEQALKNRQAQLQQINVQPVMNDEELAPYNKEQEEEIKQARERLLRQKQMAAEIPIEINNQVQGTVNEELQRLRQEMQFSQNHLSEQLLNVRGAIVNTNSEKDRIEEDIRRLQQELNKAQYNDEIRQREIYNAFIVKKPPTYFVSNTEKLIEPELRQFFLPKKPRPYYNRGDPYINGFNTQHQHIPLENASSLVPYKRQDVKCGQERYLDQFIFDKEKKHPILDARKKDYYKENVQGELDRNGIEFEDKKGLAHVPDDYRNRQNLYIPRDEDVDLQHILVKNQNRIDALEEVFIQDKDHRRLDELDEVLFKNMLKRDNQFETKLGPKVLKLHYDYDISQKSYNKGEPYQLQDYDNNRSIMYGYGQ